MLEAQNGFIPSPSPQSLSFRSKLASLVSPLRRVRPRVPFYCLAAHRLPTLWGLYRGLLHSAPTENIQHRVRMVFRANHHMTSTERTIRELRKGYKWLETFERARSGDVKTQALLWRYDRFIEMKIEKEKWKELVRNEMAWQHRLRNRPILTGGFLHPTLYNPPLPRMKPQPEAISRMIVTRMKQRERRFARVETWNQYLDMVRREQQSENELLKIDNFEPVFSGEEGHEWSRPLTQAKRQVLQNVTGTSERNMRPFSKELLEQVRAARSAKIANKTKERERERRGEVLRKTIERRRKYLTAHLLSTLPEKQKTEELIVQRSSAEVGYVGLLKKRKGWKLREPRAKVDGKQWSVEDAEWIGPEDQTAAARTLLALQDENAKRREASGPATPLQS